MKKKSPKDIERDKLWVANNRERRNEIARRSHHKKKEEMQRLKEENAHLRKMQGPPMSSPKEHDYLEFPNLQQIQNILRGLLPANDLVIGDIALQTHGRISCDKSHFCGNKGTIKALRAVDRKKETYINISLSHDRTYHYAIGFWDIQTKKNTCVAHGTTKNYQYAISQYLALKGK